MDDLRLNVDEDVHIGPQSNLARHPPRRQPMISICRLRLPTVTLIEHFCLAVLHLVCCGALEWLDNGLAVVVGKYFF
jgi:hypothetical protein